MQTTWSSEGIHIDGHVCVDVKAGRDGVVLGQLHGEHNSYASDLRLTADDAEAIADALLAAAKYTRAAQA